MTAPAPSPSPRPRWSIGQFSRMTRLSARQLRHYDALGLLTPSYVDPFTGYRYYSAEEVTRATALRTLREAGLGLPEIRSVLPGLLKGEDAAWRLALTEHLHRLEAEEAAVGRRRELTLALLTTPQEVIMPTQPVPSDGVTAVPEIRTVPAHTVLAQRTVVPTYADQPVLWEAFEQAVAATGAALTGDPCGATYFEEGYTKENVDVEVWEVVAGPVEVPAPLTCRQVPEHRVLVALHEGPYTGIDAVYTRVLRAMGERGLSGAGPCYERYLVGPAHTADGSAWRTEVCFPVTGG